MNLGVNFHETFPPSPVYISRLLAVSDGTPRSVFELSDLTGIPQGKSSGKVGPHLSYMMLMGLLEEDKATLTPLGQLVRREDPACHEVLTQWLLHANLTSVQGAAMWNYVYRIMLPANGGSVSMEYFDKQMGEHFGVRKRPAVIKSCYTKGFPAMQYLKDDSEVLTVLEQKIHLDYQYLYAYDVLREWEVVYRNELEITAEQFGRLQNASCFGLNHGDWFIVLEMLCSAGILRLNRQLSPFTVIKTVSAAAILDKIYSLLM